MDQFWVTDGRPKWGSNANPELFSGRSKTRSHQVVRESLWWTWTNRCLSMHHNCYRYSSFMFQRNALERGLLKKKKSLDLLASAHKLFVCLPLNISTRPPKIAQSFKVCARKKELIALYIVCQKQESLTLTQRNEQKEWVSKWVFNLSGQVGLWKHLILASLKKKKAYLHCKEKASHHRGKGKILFC